MADLHTLLRDAAPVRDVPMDLEDAWSRGRRQRLTHRAGVGIGTLIVIGIAALGSASLLDRSGADVTTRPEEVITEEVNGMAPPIGWTELTGQSVTAVESAAPSDVWTTLATGADIPDPRVRDGVLVASLAVSPSGLVAIGVDDKVVVLAEDGTPQRSVVLGGADLRALAVDDDGRVWALREHPEQQQLLEVHHPDGRVEDHQLQRAGFSAPGLQVVGDEVLLVQGFDSGEPLTTAVGSNGRVLRGAQDVLTGAPGGWTSTFESRQTSNGLFGFGATRAWTVRVSRDGASVGLDLPVGGADSSIQTLGLSVDGHWTGMVTVQGDDCPGVLVTLGWDEQRPAATCVDPVLESAGRGFTPFLVTHDAIWWLAEGPTDPDDRSTIEVRRIDLPGR